MGDGCGKVTEQIPGLSPAQGLGEGQGRASNWGWGEAPLGGEWGRSPRLEERGDLIPPSHLSTVLALYHSSRGGVRGTRPGDGGEGGSLQPLGSDTLGPRCCLAGRLVPSPAHARCGVNHSRHQLLSGPGLPSSAPDSPVQNAHGVSPRACPGGHPPCRVPAALALLGTSAPHPSPPQSPTCHGSGTGVTMSLPLLALGPLPPPCFCPRPAIMPLASESVTQAQAEGALGKGSPVAAVSSVLSPRVPAPPALSPWGAWPCVSLGFSVPGQGAGSGLQHQELGNTVLCPAPLPDHSASHGRPDSQSPGCCQESR